MVYVTRCFVRLVALVRGWLTTALDRVGAMRTRAQRVVDRLRDHLPPRFGPVTPLCTALDDLLWVLARALALGSRLGNRIGSALGRVFEAVVYLARWLCWPADWLLFRLPLYLRARFGEWTERTLPVHVTVVDGENGPVLTETEVRERMAGVDALFEQCGVTVDVSDIEVVEADDLGRPSPCGIHGLFAEEWTTFCRRSHASRTGEPVIEVYFVNSIPNADGCAYPRADWAMVDADAPAWIVAQELAHLCHVWRHRESTDNIVYHDAGDHDNFTYHQSCMIRSSRFVVCSADD